MQRRRRDCCDYRLGGGGPGTPAPAQPTNLLALFRHIRARARLCFSFPGLEGAKGEKGPLTSHPNLCPRRSLGYLLSQKRRARASRTRSTAALRTSVGGSSRPSRRPFTKLWKTRVPSSSPSVRLCRFSVCSPELCAREEAGHLPGSGRPSRHPQVGGDCSQCGHHSLTRVRSSSTPSRMSSWWPSGHTVRASRLRGQSWSRYLPGSCQSSKQ